VDLTDRLTLPEIRAVLSDGSGRMPGFARLGSDALSAIQRYVVSAEDTSLSSPSPEGRGRQGVRTPERSGGQGVRTPIDQKYRVQYGRFLDPDGYPAVKPPWGTLSAIDLNTGEYRWKIPLGEYRELAAQGMTDTGCENYGGPVVTAGGLVFIGATNYDSKFRAFDKATGELLWETTLPAAGNATPARSSTCTVTNARSSPSARMLARSGTSAMLTGVPAVFTSCVTTTRPPVRATARSVPGAYTSRHMRWRTSGCFRFTPCHAPFRNSSTSSALVYAQTSIVSPGVQFQCGKTCSMGRVVHSLWYSEN